MQYSTASAASGNSSELVSSILHDLWHVPNRLWETTVKYQLSELDFILTVHIPEHALPHGAGQVNTVLPADPFITSLVVSLDKARSSSIHLACTWGNVVKPDQNFISEPVHLVLGHRMSECTPVLFSLEQPLQYAAIKLSVMKLVEASFLAVGHLGCDTKIRSTSMV